MISYRFHGAGKKYDVRSNALRSKALASLQVSCQRLCIYRLTVLVARRLRRRMPSTRPRVSSKADSSDAPARSRAKTSRPQKTSRHRRPCGRGRDRVRGHDVAAPPTRNILGQNFLCGTSKCLQEQHCRQRRHDRHPTDAQALTGMYCLNLSPPLDKSDSSPTKAVWATFSLTDTDISMSGLVKGCVCRN